MLASWSSQCYTSSLQEASLRLQQGKCQFVRDELISWTFFDHFSSLLEIKFGRSLWMSVKIAHPKIADYLNGRSQKLIGPSWNKPSYSPNSVIELNILHRSSVITFLLSLLCFDKCFCLNLNVNSRRNYATKPRYPKVRAVNFSSWNILS